MKNRKNYAFALLAATTIVLGSCSDKSDPVKVHDPGISEKVSVDRFSAMAGHLMVRTATNGLPVANAPINFDLGEPYITKGKGPSGQNVEYYNFDVQPNVPAPIYVLFREGDAMPVSGQPNIIDVLPGEAGYSDFWLIQKVTVPANYVANQVASYEEIMAAKYPVEATTSIVNCPVVPTGSTASKRLNGESTALVMGWYKSKVVTYLNFGEKSLTATSGHVPTSPIFVCFNINLDQNGGGPPSGFKTETGSAQTHNVTGSIPSDNNYSPLWDVIPYSNASFDAVNNSTTAAAAAGNAASIGTVNCPIVMIE